MNDLHNIMITTQPNPFSILGIPNNTSIKETKKCFRKLSMRAHPDKGGDEKQYAKFLDAYHLILNGYKITAPHYKPTPKPNNNIYSVDVFITLDEGFMGCQRNIYLKDGISNITIPKGVIPMQNIIFDGAGETNNDGVRGKLSVTIKFIMPEGFTFEKYLTDTVLVYNVRFKEIPKIFNITVCNKTKKVKVPSKIYNGMFLKINDFGYVNNNKKNPLYVKIII